MTIKINEIDRYNFNRGAKDITTKTPDDVNGRFVEIGWAKDFTTRGVYTKSVSWTVAEGNAWVPSGGGSGGRRGNSGDR